jgi:hypothetical protein
MSKQSKKATIAPKKMANGTTILTGKTREEVAAKFEELKASCEGATLMAGAVGQKADGTFELRIDITNA